ncbi:hypothetical protein B484DRAFT_484201, partial [Ochromonadaceae sp. CCMP2298]
MRGSPRVLPVGQPEFDDLSELDDLLHEQRYDPRSTKAAQNSAQNSPLSPSAKLKLDASGGSGSQKSGGSLFSLSTARVATLDFAINYLSLHIERIETERVMKDFEALIAELLDAHKDPQLLHIMKAHAWTGTRFRPNHTAQPEMLSLLQDLSNLYLRRSKASSLHSSGVLGVKDEQAAQDIFSFLPDRLLEFLAEQHPAEG